jgi:hypothetical protein
MSVYSRGDGDSSKKDKDKDKDIGKQLEKGLYDVGKSIGGFFSGLGGSDKKWKSKGEGQTLGGGGSASADASRAPVKPRQSASAPAQQAQAQAQPAVVQAHQSAGPPADKAALAAAAEARAAKLAPTQQSAAKRKAAAGYRSFAPAEPAPPSSGGGFDPTRAQFNSLATARSAVDVDAAIDAERRAGHDAEARWRASAQPAAGAPVEPDRALVAQLMEMGFESGDAAQALAATANELEQAVALLSDGGAPEGGGAGGGGAPSWGEPPMGSSSALADAGEPGDVEGDVSELVLLAAAGGDEGGAALALIAKLIGNVAEHPAEPKYKRIRRTNPRVGAVLGAAPAAERLLIAAGFVLDPTGEFYDCVLPADDARFRAAFAAVTAALAQLAVPAAPAVATRAQAASQPDPTAESSPLRAPEPRNMVVYRLPERDQGLAAAARFDVPDDFYEIGAAEAKVRPVRAGRASFGSRSSAHQASRGVLARALTACPGRARRAPLPARHSIPSTHSPRIAVAGPARGQRGTPPRRDNASHARAARDA